MSETLHVYVRHVYVPQQERAQRMGTALPRAPAPTPPGAWARARTRAERVERRITRRLDLDHALRELHAEPAVLREQGHDAGYDADRAGEEGACVRVRGEVSAAELKLAQLVARGVDLGREARGESVGAAHGGLQEERARDARHCAD